jgi:hypothetical protein
VCGDQDEVALHDPEDLDKAAVIVAGHSDQVVEDSLRLQQQDGSVSFYTDRTGPLRVYVDPLTEEQRHRAALNVCSAMERQGRTRDQGREVLDALDLLVRRPR